MAEGVGILGGIIWDAIGLYGTEWGKLDGGKWRAEDDDDDDANANTDANADTNIDAKHNTQKEECRHTFI